MSLLSTLISQYKTCSCWRTAASGMRCVCMCVHVCACVCLALPWRCGWQAWLQCEACSLTATSSPSDPEYTQIYPSLR